MASSNPSPPPQQIALTGRLFARNTAFNLGGEVAAFCIGLICIPYVIKTLGTDVFGILSIAWMLLGYMSLFDLGLTRATTKFVAEAVGNGDHQQLPTLIWTSVLFQLMFGLFGAALFLLSTHMLVTRIFKIPVPLMAQAEKSFQFLAIAVPIILVTNCLRGVLEARQQFNLINFIKVATNILMFSSPFLLIPFGGKLPSIILLMTILRLVAMLVYLRLCLLPLRNMDQKPTFQRAVLARLLRYGAWVTVSNVTGPLLLYADRFAIGALLSVAALAYYTGPADMLNRTLVIPASLGSTLFPAFSSLQAGGALGKLEDFYARSLKYLVVLMGPPLLLIAVFSRDILYLWLGPVFAKNGAVPLRVLALGVFISSLGLIPYGLLQGAGRPDITAIFHLVELPVHLALVWVLVSKFGITGAAIAVTLRVLLDTALILWACDWVGLASLRAVHERGVTISVIGLLMITAMMCAPFSTSGSLFRRLMIAVLLCSGYLIAQWFWSLDSRDRKFALATVRHLGVNRSPMVPSLGAKQYAPVPTGKARGIE
jgi:O-antigen/teichoic acid export membrane protein